MRDLLLATTNSGKIREIRAALKGLDWNLVCLADLADLAGRGGPPSVVEDGDTFEANARKKGRHYAAWSGRPALADDSGLVVPALQGRPGVHSARYAGDHASDADNRRKLLEEMAGVPEGKRGAAFVCCLVLAFPHGGEFIVEERCEGSIGFEEKGKHGFGYDPLFFFPPLNRTSAELDLEEKNRISHRGKALRRLAEFLRNSCLDIPRQKNE